MVANEHDDVRITGPQEATDEAAPASPKSGIKTSEFWLAFAMLMLSAYLASKGKDELAAMLASVAGATYVGFRSFVKSKVPAAALLVGCLLFLPGCSGIRPDAIEPLLEKVVERHDGYVSRDQSKDPARKASELLSSDLLLLSVDEAQGEPRDERKDSQGRPRAR